MFHLLFRNVSKKRIVQKSVHKGHDSQSIVKIYSNYTVVILIVR